MAGFVSGFDICLAAEDSKGMLIGRVAVRFWWSQDSSSFVRLSLYPSGGELINSSYSSPILLIGLGKWRLRVRTRWDTREELSTSLRL